MDNQTAFSNLLLDENFQHLNRTLKKLTIFDILRIEDKEVPFTCLLAWLLDPYADHQMGPFPIRSFLRHCLRREKRGEEVINALQLEELNFADVRVSSEYQIDIEMEGDAGDPEKKKGRLDVYVELSTANGQGKKYPLLLIEAKIGAFQHNGQTHRYQQWVKERSGENSPFQPVLIYLTPEGEYDETVASDFTPMDFTQLNSWLDTLRPILKSAQAEFLIKELYTLNSRTNRARDGEFDNLAEKIRQENVESLKVLKEGLQLSGSVAEEYEPALVFMGLMAARRGSLGFDSHISIVREAAQELLSEDNRWKISGGEGSMTIRYLPLQEMLNRNFQGANVLNLDCWLDRSKNHLELAVYSIKNKIPATINDVKLRKSLVNELRRICLVSELTRLQCQSGDNFQVARIALPRNSTSLDSAREQLGVLLALATHIDRWLESSFREWKEDNIL
jgi:hypothetical protein